MRNVVCIDNRGRNDLIIGKKYEILEAGYTAGIPWYRIAGIRNLTCVADRFAKCTALNNNIRVL